MLKSRSWVGVRLAQSTSKKYSTAEDTDEDDEYDDEEVLEPIQVVNIIFLPFEFWWQCLVCCVVIARCILAPLIAIYPWIWCKEEEIVLEAKLFYGYICDIIYFFDTVLHMLHRQIEAVASEREHLPKSTLLLIIDIVSLMPLVSLFVDLCRLKTIEFWPNILKFNEVLIIYRIPLFLSLHNTHSYKTLTFGYTLMVLLIAHILSCFFILMTMQGMCEPCVESGSYDWRYYYKKFENRDLTSIQLGYAFVFILFVGKCMGYIFTRSKPTTYTEYLVDCALYLILIYIFFFIIIPKCFSEAIYCYRYVFLFQTNAVKAIAEARRRNPNSSAYKQVEKYYYKSWTRNSGIMEVTRYMLAKFPYDIQCDVHAALTEPVFYHSPMLRNTSESFKRWLGPRIKFEYKLSGERFYKGKHCFTRLYYVNSGVLQINCGDDGTAGMIYVTEGTVLGDVSFLVPPIHRQQVFVHCHTYCEVASVSRADLIRAMYRFPKDRYRFRKLASQRLQHARQLLACKETFRHKTNLNIIQERSVTWLKRRWWEIYNAIETYKSKDGARFELLPETSPYHCCKYIGMFALCEPLQIAHRTFFARDTYPWILAAYSQFWDTWNDIIIATVYVALVLLPPNITREPIDNVMWFQKIFNLIDFMYILDVFLLLVTVRPGFEHNATLFGVFIDRCRHKYFVMDVMSTRVFGSMISAIVAEDYKILVKYNRLLKTYLIFYNRYKETWSEDFCPVQWIYTKIIIAATASLYVLVYFLFWFVKRSPAMNFQFWYNLCLFGVKCEVEDEFSGKSIVTVLAGFLDERFLPNASKTASIYDLALMGAISLCSVFAFTYMCTILIAMEYQHMSIAQFFVSMTERLHAFYVVNNIHPDLLKRFYKYIQGHWAYFHGLSLMSPNRAITEDEPQDMHTANTDVAEKIIGQSPVLVGADPRLIKELGDIAKFLMYPKDCHIVLSGTLQDHLIWLAQGYVKVEYQVTNAESRTIYSNEKHLLSINGVFFNEPALKTYTTASDCELLYIQVYDFWKIIKKYPLDEEVIQIATNELRDQFKEISKQFELTHGDDHLEKLHSPSRRAMEPDEKRIECTGNMVRRLFHEFRNSPQSKFIVGWSILRATTVFLAITASLMIDGIGAYVKRPLKILQFVCDGIGIMDMCLKLFLPYYTKEGLIIKKPWKCAVHYLTGCFALDFCGTILAHDWLIHIVTMATIEKDSLWESLLRFAYLYLITGILGYFADVPKGYTVYLKILKLQALLTLLTLRVSKLLINICVSFEYNSDLSLNKMVYLNQTCWMPSYIVFNETLNFSNLHLIFVSSLSYVQNSFWSRYILDELSYSRLSRKLATIYVTVFMLLCYNLQFLLCVAYLVLRARTTTFYEAEVNTLKYFLKSERIDKSIIKNAVHHFFYFYKRTKGADISLFARGRVGFVFRQDLNFFFYKQTFKGVDTLLKGGVMFQRRLATNVVMRFFLPDADIIREMRLVQKVYFIHRGQVLIEKEGVVIAILTKGCIFGLLDSSKPRAARSTARAHGHVDVLSMPAQLFQQYLNDSRMLKPVTIDSSKEYRGWLFLVWVVGAVLVSVITPIYMSTSRYDLPNIRTTLYLLDLLHLAFVISEFFTMEIVVMNDMCDYQYIRRKQFKKWERLLDVFSLILPALSFMMNGDPPWTKAGHWARLLRSIYIIKYHREITKNFQARSIKLSLKILIVFMLLHWLTCFWQYLACNGTSPHLLTWLHNDWIKPFPKNMTIDPGQWVHPSEREQSCLVARYNVFMVAKHWQMDYVIVFTYILVILYQINVDVLIPLEIHDLYVKVFACAVLAVIRIWIISAAICEYYASIRYKFYFDYQVNMLNKYLDRHGVSKVLQFMAKHYADRTWVKVKGNQMPELARKAPRCLREDLMCALYYHHVQAPSVFRTLPEYFLRQLASRLKRTLIFPGHCIVKQGDIWPVMCFVHQGEVEKWATNIHGAEVMISLKKTNGFFGLVPALYPTTPYAFSYYSKTVVDIMYLEHESWIQLLDGYPELKEKMYKETAKDLKVYMHVDPNEMKISGRKIVRI